MKNSVWAKVVSFIYNFSKLKKIIDKVLVAHGLGSETGIVDLSLAI
jgi:hypothetical protein